MAWKWVNRLTLLSLLFLSACTTTLASMDQSRVWEQTNDNTSPTNFLVSPSVSITEPPSWTPSPASTAENTSEFTWANTSTPAVIGLTSFSDGINPLTGLPVEDPENLDRRPVLIKVSNYPRGGRPHAGLSYADLVFEYYIGEQMNRFLALYYGDNSPQVGPLRSGRLIDYQLASMYGGILVYGGADPKVDTQILNVLHERAFTNNTTPCPPICGQDTHSISGVFVDSGSMTEYVIRKEVDNTPPVLNGMLFDPTPPTSEISGTDIGVEYSFRDRGEWHYDTGSGKYMRWIEEDDQYTMIPLLDRVNDQPLGFSNVIVLFATYQEYAPTLHDILVWENTGGNSAYVFRDGVVLEGSWRVPDHERPIQLYNTNGLPIVLKPGNTWIVFLGQRSIIERPQDSQWEFFFDLP